MKTCNPLVKTYCMKAQEASIFFDLAPIAYPVVPMPDLRSTDPFGMSVTSQSSLSCARAFGVSERTDGTIAALPFMNGTFGPPIVVCTDGGTNEPAFRPSKM